MRPATPTGAAPPSTAGRRAQHRSCRPQRTSRATPLRWAPRKSRPSVSRRAQSVPPEVEFRIADGTWTAARRNVGFSPNSPCLPAEA
eukprot:6981982-Pyramimonas_sp.AAC.1